MRLRCKQSKMPCTLVNFISVNWESEAGQRGQREEDTRKKEGSKVEIPQQVRKGVQGGDQLPPPWIQLCPAMSSRLSLCAGMEVPVRTRSSSKAVRRRERERAQRSMCCPFTGAFAHEQRCAVCATSAACLDKSSLASPCLVHKQAQRSPFLQVVVAVFLEARKRQQRQCRDKTS